MDWKEKSAVIATLSHLGFVLLEKTAAALHAEKDISPSPALVAFHTSSSCSPRTKAPNKLRLRKSAFFFSPSFKDKKKSSSMNLGGGGGDAPSPMY